LPGSAPPLSVIIVNTNTRDWLRACLVSLQEQKIYNRIEVIVVDNASADGSVEMMQSEYSDCELIQSGGNIGFGPANNMGAAAALAPVLLFLNQDTEVRSGSLARMLEILEGYPDWGAAGGLVYDSDGEPERSTGSFPTFSNMLLNTVLTHLSVLRPLLGGAANQHWKGYDRTRSVDWVTGAYLWVRKSVFDDLGGFDENIFLYCEDIELCCRIRKLGWACWFFPEAPIVHHRNKAPVPRARKKMFYEYLHYYGRKHCHLPRYGATRLFFWACSKL
jgi:GT2 family glycosyltransferase